MDSTKCSTHFKDKEFRDKYTEAVLKQVQEEKYRGPVPGEGLTYPQENWVDFNVPHKKGTLKLNTYRYPAEGQRKAVLIIFHGLNAHIGRTTHLAQAYSKKGIETVGFDYRGFGKSEGERGFCESHDILMSDVESFVKIVENQYKNEKIFIGGQSWGGQVCYLLTLNNPNRFAGVLFFAPALKDNKKNSPFSKMIACAIGAIFPSVKLVDQKHGFANKNPAVSESFPKDPYIYNGKIIPGTLRVLINKMDEVEKTYKQYKAPFIIFSCGVDKLVDPLLGFDLMDESPSTDKTHTFYDNAWHNLFGEVEIHDAIKKSEEWMLKRC